jgi:DNA-binding response OmpR family regulator
VIYCLFLASPTGIRDSMTASAIAADTSLLPQSLALIDDDREYGEFLAQYLRDRGVRVDVFDDSNRFLAHTDPYGYDFYLVDLMLPGIDGLDLIRILRLRTQAGVLVVSGRLAPDVFAKVVEAGADMYLAKPVTFEQVEVAIKAVRRRSGASGVTAPASTAWRLDRRARQLLAPDGAVVDLSDIDVTVMECFVAAKGADVTRDQLRQRLGQSEEGDSLNATIYRLRRRIEKATPLLVPLQSRSRVGYVFKGELGLA